MYVLHCMGSFQPCFSSLVPQLHSLFFLYIAPIYFFNTLYIEFMEHILNTCVHAVTPYSCCDQYQYTGCAKRTAHFYQKKVTEKLLIANQKKIIVLFEPLYTYLYHNPWLTSHHLNFKLAIDNPSQIYLPTFKTPFII